MSFFKRPMSLVLRITADGGMLARNRQLIIRGVLNPLNSRLLIVRQIHIAKRLQFVILQNEFNLLIHA
ncbi:hypothetical protein B2K_06425 [Paenibacillus mucilaginosus K02]|uniref:Uncharacterized protein n=1 Tax=Paenibacillus mucilaginosus K02 TaxID=997761 RepID=I0BDB5_9BACL|nr:hypothetical protein B2K_06425 [Paenibacillus mucilaginosus K02]